MQRGSAREIRETKVDEEFQGNATQRSHARKRNERNKVDKEVLGNAMQRGSERERNQRHKSCQRVSRQSNAAHQCKKEK